MLPTSLQVKMVLVTAFAASPLMVASSCTSIGEETREDDTGDTAENGSTVPGDPVDFAEVVSGYDDASNGEHEHDCSGQSNDECCSDLSAFLVSDESALVGLFESELNQSVIPEVDFSGNVAVVSYTEYCQNQPTHLEVEKVYLDGHSLYLVEVLYRSSPRFEDGSRPYNVVTLADEDQTSVSGETSVVLVKLQDWEW